MRFTPSLVNRRDTALKDLPAFYEALVTRFASPNVLTILDDSKNFAGFRMAASSKKKGKKKKAKRWNLKGVWNLPAKGGHYVMLYICYVPVHHQGSPDSSGTAVLLPARRAATWSQVADLDIIAPAGSLYQLPHPSFQCWSFTLLCLICVCSCGWSPSGFVPVRVVFWIVFLLLLLFHLNHHLQLSSQVSSITFTYTCTHTCLSTITLLVTWTVRFVFFLLLLLHLRHCRYIPGLSFICTIQVLFLFIPATFVPPCCSVFCTWFIKPTGFGVSSVSLVFLGALA